MEGVGARLGRSSTRYGPATVFTGPVRKWKKKWVQVTPLNTSSINNNNHHHHHQSNGNSSVNNDNNPSHIMLYKWTPISQSETDNSNGNGNVDVKEEGGDVGEEDDDDDEPPRRKIKYIPIALLEEQKKESPEEHNDESVEADTNPKVDSADGKPDINDVPMEEKEVSEEINAGRQEANESKLDLNARDGDEDGEETEEQER